MFTIWSQHKLCFISGSLRCCEAHSSVQGVLLYSIWCEKAINNYLDDFLFIARACLLCNWLIEQFLLLSRMIGLPINMSKTEWATQIIVFLGILLNGVSLTISVPEDKRRKAVDLLENLIAAKRTTVKQLQVLCGYLNFLCRAVYPGRAFLRQMYAKYTVPELGYQMKFILKPHHHVRLDKEFKLDASVWVEFLKRKIQIHCLPADDRYVNRDSS